MFVWAYNKLQLTKCRRADDKLYNLIKSDNIPYVKPWDFTETNEYKNNIHICYTNKKRIEIRDVSDVPPKVPQFDLFKVSQKLRTKTK